MIFALEFLHRAADLTLVPSAAIGRDLEAARVTEGTNKDSISYRSICINIFFSFNIWQHGKSK